MNPLGPELTTIPDVDLVARTRDGDGRAYAELWRRYAGPARAAAIMFTHSFDPDDLVAEAFTRIYRLILSGGGPSTAFRAYLIRTVQNVAISWSRRQEADPLDTIDMLADPTAGEVAAAEALDRDIVAKAFATLPNRWQEILWYTEVDGRKPREIAPKLGMTPNTVSALAYRAKEGLRQAWIQAHLSSENLEGDHRWTVERLGAHARGKAAKREQGKVEGHLRECVSCRRVAAESKRIASVLPWALLPMAGGVGAVMKMLGSGAGPVQTVASPRLPGIRRIGDRFAGAAKTTQLLSASLVTGTFVILGGAAITLASSIASPPEISAGPPPLSIEPPATSEASPPPPAVTGTNENGNRQYPPAIPVLPLPGSSPVVGPLASTDAVSESPSANSQPPARSSEPTSFPSPSPSPAPTPVPSATPQPSSDAVSAPTILTVDTGTGARQNLLYPIISGTAEPRATVTLSNGTSALVMISADADGYWSTGQLTAYGPGTSTLSITQTTVEGSTSPPATTRVMLAAPPIMFAATGRDGFSIVVIGSTSGSIKVLTDQKIDWGVHELLPGFLGTYDWAGSFTWVPSPGLHDVSVQYVFGDRSGPPRITTLPFG